MAAAPQLKAGSKMRVASHFDGKGASRYGGNKPNGHTPNGHTGHTEVSGPTLGRPSGGSSSQPVSGQSPRFTGAVESLDAFFGVAR